MGGAFYGLSDDENALFYNPAGLGFREDGADLMVSLKLDASTNVVPALQTLLRGGSRTVASVMSDLNQFQGQALAANVTPLFAYYVRKYFSMGLLVADTKIDVALLGRDMDTTVDITALSDSGLFVGFAAPVLPGLVVGANAKGLFRVGGHRAYTVLDIAQNNGFAMDLQSMGGAGGGVDFDLGATYQLPEILDGVTMRASLVANNLLGSQLNTFRLSSSTSAPPSLPRMLTLAGYMRVPGFSAVEHIDFVLDLAEFAIGGQSDPLYGARTGSLWKHVNFGAEGRMFGWLYGRAGFRQGNFTLGIGLDARYFQMDIATYAEELASLPGRLTSRRVALRLAAGFGGAARPVRSATRTEVEEPSKRAPGKSETGDPSKPFDKAAPAAPEQPHGQNSDFDVSKSLKVSLH